MDVDRLRPGTVPLAPETVLWFEFLLDTSLLEKHLVKPNPDPSAVDLIIKFLSVDRKEETITIDDENNENKLSFTANITKRSLAIKLLTLKTMAFLHWDLNIMEAKLPLAMQVTLLHDLLYVAMEEEVSVQSHVTTDFSSWDHQRIFAVSLYRRWVLKAYICGSLITKQARVPFIPMPGLQDPNLVAANQREEIHTQLDAQIMDSVELINGLLNEVPTLTIPTIESFVQLTEETLEPKVKWSNGVTISPEEFKCQIHYEMGSFCMFREDYKTAKHHFTECLKHYQALEANPSLKTKVKFCLIDNTKLEGYCLAFDIPCFPENIPDSVVNRFKNALRNQYTGIMQILQIDNIVQEIPLIDRDLLEVDIQVAMCSSTFTVAKDLLLKIQILNLIRRVSTDEIPNVDFLKCVKINGDKATDFFMTSLKSLMYEATEETVINIKYYLTDLVLRSLSELDESPQVLADVILNDDVLKNVFSKEEITDIQIRLDLNLSDLEKVISSFNSDVPLRLIERSPRLEVINMQQQLIQTYDTGKIKKLLQKLCLKDSSKSWWRLNNKWDLPIPLQSVVVNLTKGYIQDLVYILLAKSKELSNIKDFRKSILLLENTAKEAKELNSISSNTLYKLNRLIEWEILLVQINQYLEEYPENNIDPGQLISSCKSCLSALQSGDSVIPRLEVMEFCAIALLNLGEWETLTSMDKRWSYLELAAAIAYACQDANKYKGSKKISRDAWDLILPVFGPTPQSKRAQSGSTSSPTGPNLTKNCLVNFLLRIREPTGLAIVISLLGRLHNVLKDEPTLEINCQYIGLWPAVVSNSNSYNSRSVAEVLTQVVLQGLKFMPTHYSFLKTLGDINYVTNDYANAIRYYLEAGSVASDFFSQHVPKTAIDDFGYKRMIKCCTQLQCPTQAAVLCQFLEDVDYSTAFKCLSETKNSHCADAMDAYYPCIWDLTVLEYLVNMHNKRGEVQRKQQVVKLIGLLELNSNNNEEIQREAANIRRGQFLRALTNQYSISSNIDSFFPTKRQKFSN